MTRKEVLDALLEGTHTFWKPSFLDSVNAAFGTTIKPYRAKASPRDPKGLTFDDGASSGVGIDSVSIATGLCWHFGVEYVSKFGRGSQVRACVEALIASGKVVL